VPTLRERRARAAVIVNKYALGCAGTAAVTGPIPGTTIALTGVEAAMTFHIARVYDFQPTITEAGTTVTALLLASPAIKSIAIEAATFLPVIGWWLIKPGIAAATCKGAGQLVIGHYEQKYKEAHPNESS
jgi:uncharacterized protein (DUF697 family)